MNESNHPLLGGPLTDREKDILDCLAEDMSNQEIADHLVLAVSTVKWYVRQLNAKFGTNNRHELIERARSLELVSEPSQTFVKYDLLEQRIRFALTKDNTRIAYSMIGNGPPLIKAANWLNHLEFDWQSPIWKHWLRDLSRDYTFIRYDERGSGLSDWNVSDFSVDAWVNDLETVVDALGLERFPLLGISQGGSVAVAYAVRHPERVSHLILYGTYARGGKFREPNGEVNKEGDLYRQLIEIGWGRDNPAFRQFFTSLFVPEGTAEHMTWFNELQRVSTSRENAVRFHDAFQIIDVRDIAPQVRVPTLVIHARDDAVVPYKEGMIMASLIPGAEFVGLESKNHVLLEDEPAWSLFVEALRRFIGS